MLPQLICGCCPPLVDSCRQRPNGSRSPGASPSPTRQRSTLRHATAYWGSGVDPSIPRGTIPDSTLKTDETLLKKSVLIGHIFVPTRLIKIDLSEYKRFDLSSIHVYPTNQNRHIYFGLTGGGRRVAAQKKQQDATHTHTPKHTCTQPSQALAVLFQRGTRAWHRVVRNERALCARPSRSYQNMLLGGRVGRVRSRR